MADGRDQVNDCVKQCPLTLTVSNLIVDSDRHLAEEQAKIHRKKYDEYRRKYHQYHREHHHRHEHMIGCPLHRSRYLNVSSQSSNSSNEMNAVSREQCITDSIVTGESIHIEQCVKSKETSLEGASSTNGVMSEKKQSPVNDKHFTQVDLNHAPHLLGANDYLNKFPGEVKSQRHKLGNKVSPAHNFNVELQMVQLKPSVDGNFKHSPLHSFDVGSSSSRREIACDSTHAAGDTRIPHSAERVTVTKREAQLPGTLNYSSANDQMNVIASFPSLKGNRNVVTLLAVIAFLGITGTFLSRGVTLNGETLERLEDSLSSSFTFFNNTFDTGARFSVPHVASKTSLTSASGVLSRTGGFVYKSYYSTKGAAESLMAALTSLVSSSEKRRAQLASIKNINSRKSAERKIHSDENSVLHSTDDDDDGDEGNLVSAETSCNKYVGTIEDGSFAFKVSFVLPSFTASLSSPPLLGITV